MMQYPTHWFALDTGVDPADSAAAIAAAAAAGLDYRAMACRLMQFKRKNSAHNGLVQPDDVVFTHMDSAIKAADDKLLLVNTLAKMGVLMLKHEGSWIEYRPANRPRLDPTAVRISRGMRCHPDTWTRIDAEAKRIGRSAGEVIDRLSGSLSL